MARQELVAQTFVELADNLVADFDAIDVVTVLTDRSVELLDATASGLVLAEPGGALQVVAASCEVAHVLELLQLQTQEGPCVDAVRLGRAVTAEDLRDETRWPRFAAEATAAGFRAAHEVPMRLRDTVIGGLNLFRSQPGALDPDDASLAQALADVATITILQERMVRDARLLSEQLQRALNSRVVIEQAKGVVAEREGVGVQQALVWLRAHARNHNRRLADVAQDVVDGRLAVAPPV